MRQSSLCHECLHLLYAADPCYLLKIQDVFLQDILPDPVDVPALCSYNSLVYLHQVIFIYDYCLSSLSILSVFFFSHSFYKLRLRVYRL